MKKKTKLILTLCVILSGALCYAHGATGTENVKGEGIPIEIMKKNNGNGPDKGNSINPTLNGKVLFVAFTENLGQVTVEVASVSGSDVSTTTVYTPNGLQVYIPVAGDYIVTFTLPNGDEYYGEFTVTD